MNTILKNTLTRIEDALRQYVQALGAWAKGSACSLCAWLGRIGKDKYQHFAVGAVVAAVGLVLPLALGFGSRFSLGYSAFAVWCLAAVEEYAIDYAPSRGDVLTTMLGGAAVWTVSVVLIFLIR